MKRIIPTLTLMGFLASFSMSAIAQQAGENIGVLPVVSPESDSEFFFKGDGNLQRQVEPTIVVSTRNPNHLAAFYIDYRTVDVPDDVNVGGGSPFVAGLWTTVKTFFARLLGRPEPRPVPVAASPAEANIGYSRSYDGGLTWSGALLPGLSFDSVPSPIKSYAATTDPVAVAGPCGVFYVAFVAFNRGADSAIAVSKFADLDDSVTGAHTIVHRGTSILATGNNATNGPFNDKVAIAVDVDRSSPGGCRHRVFVSYTEFDGLDKSGKFQSKVYLATRAFADETTSLDGVTGWAKRENSGSFTQNQGTALAVDPLNGDVYLFWRHFFKPDTIVCAKGTASAAASARLGRPKAIFSNAMATFDQPGVSIASGKDNLAFRTNAFPTAAISVDSSNPGRIFVAWQERVGTNGFPATVGGSPRIVLTRSDDGGNTWTARKAVDMADRPPEPAGLGFANGTTRPSYPQVMPFLSFGGGQLLLVYSEARGEVGPSGFITAYNRIVDHRGAVLDPVTGSLLKSFQISRYPIKPWAASPSTSNSIDDLEPVNPPCSPDFGPGFDPCVPRINRIVPQSAGGTIAFMGDYNWLTSSVSFVPDGNGGWKWATQATDVPWVGGHTVFADSRNLVPPTFPPEADEWNRFSHYAPPGSSLCTNAGSRNTDVMASRLSLGLLVTSPLVFRDTPAEFPFTLWNQTDQTRFFELTIETAAVNVGFGKVGTPFENTREGIVQVLPYSSSSHVVYIEESGQPRVKVSVTEVFDYDGAPVAGPLTGQITFNAETTHPQIVGGGSTKALEVSNPFPENPFPENPFPENPFPENPFPENPFPENPFPENTAVGDVSWTVTAPTGLSADTIAAYAALIGIDEAYWSNYGFQLIISKPSTTGVFQNCADPAFNVPQGTIVSNYFLPSIDPSNPFPENPFPENPFPENPFPENPFPENPFPENSAFTIAPSDTGSTSSFAATSASTGRTEAPPAADLYKITLRAYKKPGAESEPDFIEFDPEKNPPAAKIAEKNCDPATSTDCFLALSPSPELYIVSPDDPPTTAPSLGLVSPNPVPAGQSIFLPGTPSVKNNGLLRASDRKHGYFLVPSSCTLPTWGAPGGGKIPGCAVLLVEDAFLDPNVLAQGASEALRTSLPIPFATTPGSYRLLVYADYRRQVSEGDETNNWAVSEPFEITPPRYAGILGLFSPCSGNTCVRNAGPALPFAFQLTFDGVTAVDSAATQPRLKIFAPVSGGACQTDTSVPPLFVADPTNVSSGSSLWQYFDATCAPVGPNVCSRPSFTNQYNWQTKDPVTGANLPAGCYTVAIEVPATQQTTDGEGPVATVQVTLN